MKRSLTLLLLLLLVEVKREEVVGRSSSVDRTVMNGNLGNKAESKTK